MSELNVRIVRIQPTLIASAVGFGTEPEPQAIGILTEWINNQGWVDQLSEHRFFGFNHPDPSVGSPNYGYEQWVTVGPDAEASGEVNIKPFSGGLYAVMTCDGIPNPEKWAKLVSWCEESRYRQAHHQWLEECLTPEMFMVPFGPETNMDSFRFDLYLPISE